MSETLRNITIPAEEVNEFLTIQVLTLQAKVDVLLETIAIMSAKLENRDINEVHNELNERLGDTMERNGKKLAEQYPATDEPESAVAGMIV